MALEGIPMQLNEKPIYNYFSFVFNLCESERKGEVNLVACAVARKLATAVWYLYQGKWTSLEEIDAALDLNVRKIAAQIDPSALRTLGLDRSQLRQNMHQSLLGKRIYFLDPNKK